MDSTWNSYGNLSVAVPYVIYVWYRYGFHVALLLGQLVSYLEIFGINSDTFFLLRYDDTNWYCSCRWSDLQAPAKLMSQFRSYQTFTTTFPSNEHWLWLTPTRYHILEIVTSANEVMFLPVFVCLFVCLRVSKITQKVMDGSFWNFEGMLGMAQTTSDSIFGVI